MSESRKLNKPYLETNRNRTNFDDFLQERHLNPPQWEGNALSPVIKKTIMIIEEVYHYSPTKGPCTSSQVHNMDDIAYSRFDSFSCDNKNAKTNTEIQNIPSLHDLDNPEIPMDIDLSNDNQNIGVEDLNTAENMDIDCNSDIKNKRLIDLTTTLKKRKFTNEPMTLSEEVIILKSSNNITTENKGYNRSCIFVIGLTMLILIAFYSVFHEETIFVNTDIQLQNLQSDLSENVYGQKNAIKVIMQSLQKRSRWASKIKVLSFIGSSGVGKTFVANILKKHFHPRLIHELYGNHVDFKNQWQNVPSLLKSCCLNLIIIDNLYKKDTSEIFSLIHSLPSDYYILILTIFSIQYSDEKLNYVINFDDINEIRHKFDNSDLFHELVVFHQFDGAQVKDWLEKKLKVQNRQYSEIWLHNVLHNHNASYEGFKGLHPKFLVENIDMNE